MIKFKHGFSHRDHLFLFLTRCPMWDPDAMTYADAIGKAFYFFEQRLQDFFFGGCSSKQNLRWWGGRLAQLQWGHTIVQIIWSFLAQKTHHFRRGVSMPSYAVHLVALNCRWCLEFIFFIASILSGIWSGSGCKPSNEVKDDPSSSP